MKKVDFSKYTNGDYRPGSILKRILWYITLHIFFKTVIPYPSVLKVFLLRLYGAKAGKHIKIKPNVNIKYPWFLEMGDYVWIGEETWVDNMAKVSIGNNVCVSQGAYITTNSHDYKKESFDLTNSPVIVEDGVWIAARAIVLGGIRLGTHAVISAGSVAAQDAKPYGIYKGMPAQLIKERVIA